jgi:hypothetical protein
MGVGWSALDEGVGGGSSSDKTQWIKKIIIHLVPFFKPEKKN